jgi:hypothetical protein
MKGFLEVTRNEFVTKSKSFKAFRAKVEAEIQPLNQRLRDIYDYGVHRVEEITGPFVSIGKGDDSDPFHKAQKKLHTLVEGNIAETRAQILGTLGQIRSLKLEETPTIIDKIKSFGETITLEENEKSFIYIDPKNKSSVAQITYDVHSDRSNVSIPPSIFDPKPITFIGDKYIVYFVDGNEIDSGISINTETGKIFVNIFSVSLKNYSISFIDMLLTVEYAHKISSGKDQMRENILLILGADYSKKSELEVYTCLETEID